MKASDKLIKLGLQAYQAMVFILSDLSVLKSGCMTPMALTHLILVLTISVQMLLPPTFLALKLFSKLIDVIVTSQFMSSLLQLQGLLHNTSYQYSYGINQLCWLERPKISFGLLLGYPYHYRRCILFSFSSEH